MSCVITKITLWFVSDKLFWYWGRLKKEKHQHFVQEKINTMFVINGVYRI
jgi:hypothetical protein